MYYLTGAVLRTDIRNNRYMFDVIFKIFRRLNSIYNSIKYNACFAHIGQKVRIYSPLKIQGSKSIYIGDSSRIGDGTWLASMPLTSSKPQLRIGSNVLIGHYNHIYCTGNIAIEDNVLTADKVYISDNIHGYEDINCPIWKQPIRQLSQVRIGEGSWIGENVCIIGASIGKHCVIGANAVVTKDIPDYSVAVGAPAIVIKSYNLETKRWESIKK